MKRQWKSFDPGTTNRELSRLPLQDRLALHDAMEAYRDDEGSYRLQSYGNGLLMLTDAGRGQGRCLFFKVIRVRDEEHLIALLFYKKETQRAPKSVIDTARKRMENFQGRTMKDYLDEIIEKDCEADPDFAKQWAKLKARKALSRLRREHHLTQATVAQRMGVPQSRVAEIEARPYRVSFIRMISYAKALGVSLEAVAEATTETA